MRFRFTIRDLLWLTLVVGLLTAWRESIPGHAAPLESLIRTNPQQIRPAPAQLRVQSFFAPAHKRA